MSDTKKPFVTVNLRLTRKQHGILTEKKNGKTWEEYFLGLAGVDVSE